MNKIVPRVLALLKSPKTEWPVIAAEPTTVGDLYKGYIMLLAAVPAVCSFIKSTVIGYGVFGLGSYRMGVGTALTSAILGYVLSLVMIYVLALIIEALAPTFGGEKNRLQALKAAAYSYTAAWVAGIGSLVPGIYILILLAGAIYSIYLLYLGLPVTMKAPREKAAGYVALVVVIGIVLGWVVGLVTGAVLGSAAYMGGRSLGGLTGSSASSDGDVQFDENSALGKLAAAGKKMEEASKKMEAAQKAGDSKAQSEALGALMASALGGAGGAAEALAPDRLKAFVPEQLAGLPRTRVKAERNGAMGIQISNASATYANAEGKGIDLEITDSGGAAGLMGLAGWANMESEAETPNGYERTRKEDGRIVHEKWDGDAKRGEFSIVLGDRFVVKADGDADSIEQLKGAVGSIDLAGLEALKNEGVKR
jgi:hypothetical protein